MLRLISIERKGKMANKEQEKLTATEKFANKTNSWIGAHSKLLIASGSAVIVLLIALLIVVLVVNNANEKKFDALAALQDSYKSLEEGGEGDFISSAEALVESAGLKTYAGAEAALMIADVYYDSEDYQNALQWYNKVADAQSKTYLYQVASINAAACLEMLGDNAKALDLYNTLWDSFGKEGLYGSRVLFNSARLYEATGNVELAKATYQQLIGEFSSSSEYSKLAQTRIDQLN